MFYLTFALLDAVDGLQRARVWQFGLRDLALVLAWSPFGIFQAGREYNWR